MRISALTLLTLFCINVQAADISNFISGTVCSDDEGHQSVCAQTEDIRVSGESICNWSGAEKPCTWFGFEFDYANADSDTPIECTYERSVPSAEGNYEGVRERDVKTGTMSYELEGPSGHFFNPMYQLYSELPDGQTALIVTHLDCAIGNVKVFDMTFRLLLGAD